MAKQQKVDVAAIQIRSAELTWLSAAQWVQQEMTAAYLNGDEKLAARLRVLYLKFIGFADRGALKPTRKAGDR